MGDGMNTQEQMQAAAEQLGFQNIDLCVDYFKARLLAEGLYEELREMQTVINQSQVNSLESCKATLMRCLDYLENRDDCWDENIDKATDAIKTATWRVQRQMDDLEDGVKYSHTPTLDELKRDDDKQRIADIRAEQRAAR